MFCAKCGTEIPDDSQFCRKCGRSLSAVATSGGAGAAVAPARIQPSTPRSRILVWFLVIMLTLFLLWAGIRIIAMQSQTLTKQAHTQKIGDGNLTVKPGNYSYVKFDVSAGATNVRLQGNFTASGGSGNDIDFYVLSQDDFVNWQNRHAAKAFYKTGKVTVNTFAVNLPSVAGTYFLVFDNRFSVLSEKGIVLNATLAYQQY